MNNNFKEGRAQCINTLSYSFIKNNWVSANFFVKELNWLDWDFKHLISPTNNPSGGGHAFEKNLIPPEDREVYKYLRKDDFSDSCKFDISKEDQWYQNDFLRKYRNIFKYKNIKNYIFIF